MAALDETLQRMINGYAADVTAVLMAMASTDTPEAARRSLIGALCYVAERFDLYPDHMKGLGVIDDAAVIRLAARHAASYGCEDPDVKRLAGENAHLDEVLADLYAPLEEFVSRLPWRPMKGMTALDVLADNEKRMVLWREIQDTLKGYKPAVLTGDQDAALRDMRKMMKHGLVKAGVLK